MKTQKEKFKSLVSKEATTTVKRNRERIKNRARLRESQQIALKVLTKLDDIGWTQKRLAEEMGVSPQQITKIVKGRENLTLETQIKLQNILDIPILATYYERMSETIDNVVKVVNTNDYTLPKYESTNEEGKKSISFSKNKIKIDYKRGRYSHYLKAV